MKNLFWKECRENALWAGIGSAVFFAILYIATASIYEWNHNFVSYMVASQIDWARRELLGSYGGGSLCGESFLNAVTLGSAAAAILLGVMQACVPSAKRREEMAACLPVTAWSRFSAKVLAGLTLYGAAVLIPYGALMWWASISKQLNHPFLWEMVLPGLSEIISGSLFYLAVLAVGWRKARWWVSGLVPLIAAAGCISATHKWGVNTFFEAFSYQLGYGILLGAAAWSLFDSRNAQSRWARVVLLLVMALGVQETFFAVAKWAGKRHEPWSSIKWIIHPEFDLCKWTRGAGGLFELRDVAGNLLEIPEEQKKKFDDIVVQREWATKARKKPSYRDSDHYYHSFQLLSDAPFFGPSLDPARPLAAAQIDALKANIKSGQYASYYYVWNRGVFEIYESSRGTWSSKDGQHDAVCPDGYLRAGEKGGTRFPDGTAIGVGVCWNDTTVWIPAFKPFAETVVFQCGTPENKIEKIQWLKTSAECYGSVQGSRYSFTPAPNMERVNVSTRPQLLAVIKQKTLDIYRENGTRLCSVARHKAYQLQTVSASPWSPNFFLYYSNWKDWAPIPHGTEYICEIDATGKELRKILIPENEKKTDSWPDLVKKWGEDKSRVVPVSPLWSLWRTGWSLWDKSRTHELGTGEVGLKNAWHRVADSLFWIGLINTMILAIAGAAAVYVTEIVSGAAAPAALRKAALACSLGLAGCVAYFTVRRVRKLGSCPSCSCQRPLASQNCPACGTEWPAVAGNGAEIFDNVAGIMREPAASSSPVRAAQGQRNERLSLPHTRPYSNPFAALVWQEIIGMWRWALGLVLLLCLYYGQSAANCSSVLGREITGAMGFGTGLAGLLFGILSFRKSGASERSPLLFMLPISNRRMFWAKTGAGLTAYFVTTLTPYLFVTAAYLWPAFGEIVLDAERDVVRFPFEWGMCLRGICYALQGTLFFFAGALLMLRQARWWGTRLLPVLAAMKADTLLYGGRAWMGVEFLNWLAWWIGCTLLFGWATWGVFRMGEFLRRRPVYSKIALIAVLSIPVQFLISAMPLWSSLSYERNLLYKTGELIKVKYHIMKIVSFQDARGNKLDISAKDVQENAVQFGVISHYLHGNSRYFLEESSFWEVFYFRDNIFHNSRLQYHYSRGMVWVYDRRAKKHVRVITPEGARNPGDEHHKKFSDNTHFLSRTPVCFWQDGRDLFYMNFACPEPKPMLLCSLPEGENINGCEELDTCNLPGARADETCIAVGLSYRVLIFGERGNKLLEVPCSYSNVRGIVAPPWSQSIFIAQTEEWGTRKTMGFSWGNFDSMMEVDSTGAIVRWVDIHKNKNSLKDELKAGLIACFAHTPAQLLSATIFSNINKFKNKEQIRVYEQENEQEKASLVTLMIPFLIVLVPVICAVLVWFWDSGQAMPLKMRVIRCVAIALLGVPGILALLLTEAVFTRERCAGCGKKLPNHANQCRHCGADRPRAATNGTEIWENPNLGHVAVNASTSHAS